jgi:glycosyltransferase involved in cell wall biosynthesis
VAEPRIRHHVVMLVRNTYTHDSRVEKEARTLAEAGHRVTVVADAGPGLPADERRDGIAVHRVARRGPRIPGLRFLVHEWRLARRLRALQPTVLHAHDTNALVPVALAAKRLGVPYVYDAHDLWLGRPRRDRGRIYFALSQAYHGFVERRLVPRAAAVLTVSPPIVGHLRRRYRLPVVHLVPNYPESDTARLERRELRDLPGGDAIDPDLPVVLYLGGLMRGRGIEGLIQAMASVPQAQLVSLGEGQLLEPLRAAAASNGARVTFLPPVPTDVVNAYAASATVGVSPYVPEGLNNRYSLPNKLFHYLAAGIPVVASDFRQVREVVEGSGSGIVVDTTRPEAIARAIRRVLADPAEAAAMGARGRAAVEERFNWQASAAVLRDAYEHLGDGPEVA